MRLTTFLDTFANLSGLKQIAQWPSNEVRDVVDFFEYDSAVDSTPDDSRHSNG